MLSLRSVLTTLPDIDDSLVLCMRRPWGIDSECELVRPEQDGSVASHVSDRGLDYFLEMTVALEALEVFGDWHRAPTVDEQAKLLIHYAEHDAFPSWVYDPT